jgi:hypothetical protein
MGYEITAELRGMDEKNIDVKFADGVLTIKGEKSEEKEEKKKDYYPSERRFGSFPRSFQVPAGVETTRWRQASGMVCRRTRRRHRKARKRLRLRRPERSRLLGARPRPRHANSSGSGGVRKNSRKHFLGRMHATA